MLSISETYAVARKLKEKTTETQRTVGETEDFVRKNEKFFVKPEGIYFHFGYPHSPIPSDILLVKLVILRHLPLDIFDQQKLRVGKKKSIYTIYGDSF